MKMSITDKQSSKTCFVTAGKRRELCEMIESELTGIDSSIIVHCGSILVTAVKCHRSFQVETKKGPQVRGCGHLPSILDSGIGAVNKSFLISTQIRSMLSVFDKTIL
jgi:hypothetical protein